MPGTPAPLGFLHSLYQKHLFLLPGHSREVGQREDWWLHVGKPGLKFRNPMKRELFWWAKQSGYSAMGFLIEAFKQVYAYRAVPQWTDKIDKQHRMIFLAIWHLFRCYPPDPAEVLWMDLTTSILLGDGWSQFSCSPVLKICPVSATWLCCSLDMRKQRYIAGWKMEELKLKMNSPSPWCFYQIPIEHYG